MGLAEQTCIPCKGGVPPLAAPERERLLAELNGAGGEWSVIDGHHLRRVYLFDDFVSALALVNRIGALAEEQGHHPDLELSWGKVGVEIWTHKIGGLTESDFVLAAKIERLKH
jgi:4a-hydroxytetrahydrobiopterin dehydratase